jgi:hypothetical protein
MDQEMNNLWSESGSAAVDVILTGILLKDEYSPTIEAKALRKVYELRAAYNIATL